MVHNTRHTYYILSQKNTQETFHIRFFIVRFGHLDDFRARVDASLSLSHCITVSLNVQCVLFSFSMSINNNNNKQRIIKCVRVCLLCCKSKPSCPSMSCVPQFQITNIMFCSFCVLSLSLYITLTLTHSLIVVIAIVMRALFFFGVLVLCDHESLSLFGCSNIVHQVKRRKKTTKNISDQNRVCCVLCVWFLFTISCLSLCLSASLSLFLSLSDTGGNNELKFKPVFTEHEKTTLPDISVDTQTQQETSNAENHTIC